MKKILLIILLTILTNNNAEAGLYTKCFLKEITHPELKVYERKSFSQMKSYPSFEDSFGRFTRYYIPGVNRIINVNEILNFEEITFELREDNSYLSTFYVKFWEFRRNISGDPTLTDSNINKIDEFKTFRSKYKVVNNSKEYIEYEPENPRWNTKLILNKKNNIIEIKTKLLFLNTPYKRDATNKLFWELLAVDFKQETNEFDYSRLIPIANSKFSIFFKCKFKAFKEDKYENFFILNNIYTLLIVGFLSLLSVILIFWKFLKKN